MRSQVLVNLAAFRARLVVILVLVVVLVAFAGLLLGFTLSKMAKK